MTDPENPFFARAMANWVWAQFFGKGIADPADDLGRSNPPVHPELLDKLAEHFVANKFDLRELIRTIATSEAYGSSSATVPGNEHDTRFFSHQLPRPLNGLPDGRRTGAGNGRAQPVRPTGNTSTPRHRGERPRNADAHPRHFRPVLPRQRLRRGREPDLEPPPGSAFGRRRCRREQGVEPKRLPLEPARHHQVAPPRSSRTSTCDRFAGRLTEKELAYWTDELKSRKIASRRIGRPVLGALNSREFSFNH